MLESQEILALTQTDIQMIKNKVLALMPVYRRIKTLGLVLPHYNEMGVDVMCIADFKDAGRLMYYNCGIFPAENNFPAKIDLALQQVKNMGYEYVLMIGCDNIITESLLQLMIDYMKDDIITLDCMDSIFLYDRMNDISAIWPGYPSRSNRPFEPAGAFRLYKRSLLDKMGWTMYDTGISLDADSWQKSTKYADGIVKLSVKDGYAIDIKDHKSMTQLDAFDYLTRCTAKQHNEIKDIVYKYAETKEERTQGEGGEDL